LKEDINKLIVGRASARVACRLGCRAFGIVLLQCSTTDIHVGDAELQ